jgi:Ras-related protein Rab-6A
MSTIVSHKAVLIGDSAVGKTSILNQYLASSCSPDHQPTIGIDFFAKYFVNDDKTVRLQLWDTAGQEKFHALIPSYLRNSSIAILVYDMTQRSTFESLQKWHQTITNVANPALIVVANKLDLEADRQVAAEEGKKFATQIGADFIETSARVPININELFEMVIAVPMAADEEPKKLEDDQTIVVTVDVSRPDQPTASACTC